MQNWYKKRKEEGICVNCGKKMDRYDKHVTCPACREKDLERREQGKSKYLIPGFHANEKLDAEAVAAQEAGLTYGQYKMRKYMEEMKKRGE